MQRSSLLLPLALATGFSSLSAQVTYFSASLDGAQEVPPVVTTARGWGLVRFDAATNNVRVFLHYEGPAATAAHLHAGAVGVNGAVIVGLTSAGGIDWTGSATLSAANAGLLLAGNTYLNVHTLANPGGETRGQVTVPVATRIGAVLNGAQEVPPTTSAASGVGIAFLHEPDNRIVYTVTTTGLSNVTAAHIHTAPAGVNGGVLEGLTGGPANYCGVTRKLTAAEVTAAKANGLYFNVHTSSFPGGEIRGQMNVTVADFRAAMDGSQEVPPVVTNAFGSGRFTINVDNTVTYSVATSGLAATAGHIHRGAVGVNGPVVVGFAGGPVNFAGTSAPQTAAELNNARTGLWYANVHTAAFPGGEIRGQVLAATLPKPYGGACPNSNGGRSQIGADGFACLGATHAVTLSGAAPTSPVVLTLGANRDLFAPFSLPLELGIVGAPGCYLFHDLLVSVPGLTDGTGCTRLPLSVPLVPPLRGGHVFAQWFVVDAGLRTSNALDMLVQ